MRASLICLIVLSGVPLLAQTSGGTLPNPKLTPGVIRPLTTAQVCTIRWGKDVRHVTQKMKQDICKVYGAPSTGPERCLGPKWELDHFISRELAGADVMANVWPQNIKEARLKDRLENYLHREVCAGKMTLRQAQTSIRTDWWAAYEKAFSTK